MRCIKTKDDVICEGSLKELLQMGKKGFRWKNKNRNSDFEMY